MVLNIPITNKPMELRNEMREVLYKGKIIPYLYTYWYCQDSGESFTTTEQDEEHLERIKRKYILTTNFG